MAAKEPKKQAIIYGEIEEMLADFTDEEIGQVFRAVLAYVNRHEEPSITDRAVRTLFRTIQGNIDRNYQAYEKRCQRNRENVQRRWNKQQEGNTDENEANDGRDKTPPIPPNTNDTTEYDRIPTVPPNTNDTYQNKTKQDKTRQNKIADDDDVRTCEEIEKYTDEIKKSQTMQETLCMALHITPQQYQGLCDDFKLEQMGKGSQHMDFSEFRQHAWDWMRIHIGANMIDENGHVTRRQKGHGNGNNDRRDPKTIAIEEANRRDLINMGIDPDSKKYDDRDYNHFEF